MKWLTILLLALFSAAVAAGEVTTNLSWDHPTQRVNGESISSEDLAGYEIEVNGSNGRSETFEVGVVNSTTDTAEYPTGDLTLQYRIRSTDEYGLTSEWSSWTTYTTTVEPTSAPKAVPIRVGSDQ